MAFIILCVLHLSVHVFWGQKSVLGVIPSWGSNLGSLIRIGWLNSESRRSDMPVNSTQHWYYIYATMSNTVCGGVDQTTSGLYYDKCFTSWVISQSPKVNIYNIYIISGFFKRAIVYTVTIKILGICILLTFKYIYLI